MKLIQMLSIRQDLLPGEALDVLRATQSSVPPMSYATISEQIRKEIGKRPEADLPQVSIRPRLPPRRSARCIARSRATVVDVAVKIQYPGVEDTVEQDLGRISSCC